jgi:hypothetical protein
VEHAAREGELQEQHCSMLAEFEAYRRRKEEEMITLTARLHTLLPDSSCGGRSVEQPSRSLPAGARRPAAAAAAKHRLPDCKTSGGRGQRKERQQGTNSKVCASLLNANESECTMHRIRMWPVPARCLSAGLGNRPGPGHSRDRVPSLQMAQEPADAHSRLALAIKSDEVVSAQRAAEMERAERLRTDAELSRVNEQLSQARRRVQDLQAQAQLVQRNTEHTSAQAERASDCAARLAEAEERVFGLQGQLSKAKTDCRHKSSLVKALQV